MKSCVDYFTEGKSSVFTAFLDCTKGFDKIDHSGMFIKLIQRGFPLCFLNILIYWYSNLSSMVKWNGAFSRSFCVFSGVRQGGVLSPHLFAVYVNELLQILCGLKLGCHIDQLFIAIMYADDICLMAPSRTSLQILLDACEKYGYKWCLAYNPSKSQAMIIGNSSSSKPLCMYGQDLKFVLKY